MVIHPLAVAPLYLELPIWTAFTLLLTMEISSCCSCAVHHPLVINSESFLSHCSYLDPDIFDGLLGCEGNDLWCRLGLIISSVCANKLVLSLISGIRIHLSNTLANVIPNCCFYYHLLPGLIVEFVSLCVASFIRLWDQNALNSTCCLCSWLPKMVMCSAAIMPLPLLLPLD